LAWLPGQERKASQASRSGQPSDHHGAGIARPGGLDIHKSKKRDTVRLRGRIIIDSNEGVAAAAVAGVGIASSGHLGLANELNDGKLVHLLASWHMGSADIHAILPAGRAAKPSARAFADFMATAFKDVMR